MYACLKKQNHMNKLIEIFWQSARLEWRYLSREGWELALLLWLPLASVLLVWWIFGSATITGLPIGVLDKDHSALSRQVVRYLDSAPALKVAQTYTDERAAQQGLDKIDVYGVVVIPDDFSRQIKQGKASPLILQLNGQFGSFSGVLVRDVQAVAGTLSAGVEMKALNKRGASPQQAENTFSPIRTSTSALFNISTDYQQFLATTLIPGLLHILAMTAGAVAFGREIRDKSLHDWLNKAGCRLKRQRVRFGDALSALCGKLLWPTLAFTVWNGMLLWLLAQTHDVVPLSWLATYLGLCLMMLVSLWLGVIVTALPMSLRMGLSSTGFITAPAFAFSGIAFPRIAMPQWAQNWSDLLPLTHYLELQQGLLEMGVPWQWAAQPLLWSALAASLLMLAASKLAQRAYRLPERWGAR
ncbi:Inner membrane transport permease ybhR [Neisseria canis]|uniref:Inner membrane transport permease ybhR n=2 Tax=Neisseria canis TaxID=493 RepID=A0A448D960_9NEIS|nr:Inner membrane transport permease ybhR [Neisseria canis]